MKRNICLILSFVSFFMLCHKDICLAQSNDFSVLLSERETEYAFRGEKENRASNVELAASKLNEYVIQPNEVFSYNDVVGNRTHQNGFKDAPVIINGELVEGIGGGVCQVSGTLHAAMLYTGMEIIESTQHSRMSLYIDPGFDSTVAWGSKDLKFKNNLPFPVKIVATTFHDKKRGHLNIKFFGKTKMYDVEVLSKIHYKSKVKTRYIRNNNKPHGYRKVEEVGTPTIAMTRMRFVVQHITKRIVLQEELKLNYNHSYRIIIIGRKEETPEEVK